MNLQKNHRAALISGMILILSMLMLLWAAPAGAENFNLPQDIRDRLTKDGIAAGEVVSWIPRIGSSSEFSFLTVRTAKGKNYLYGFKEEKGSWKLYVKSEHALPYGKMAVHLQDNSPWSGAPSFTTYYEAGNGEIMEMCCEWMYKGSAWKLQGVYHYGYYRPSAGIMFFDTSREGRLHLWNTGWAERETDVWLEGTLETDLRHFDLTVFPLTLQAARDRMTVAPSIPTGTLSAEKIKFTGGKKYNVYTGPGENYLRGANGKAVVSTNDWIQVFGRENGWILIQYAISRDHMRFGWIPEKALPKGASVGGVNFTTAAASLSRACVLTDDPLFSQTALLSLPEGSRVTWLATMGDWAYVESTSGDLVRGFVPMSALTTGTAFNLANWPLTDGRAVLEGQMTVTGYTVSARIRPMSGSGLPESITAFRLYDSFTGQLVLTVSMRDSAGYRMGTGALTAGTTSLRIVPVDGSGNEWTDWAVEVEW